LVTAELVDNPEAELIALKRNFNAPERIERFEKAAIKELEDIKAFIVERAGDFGQLSDLDIYEKRIELIAELYLKTTSDINTAFEDFREMYKEIKQEESTLLEKLDINISFDDSAVDELMRQAMETGQEPGPLTFYLAKKLEYGLKLVRDRSGVDHFVINGEAVTDMENYINNLVKKFYRQAYESGFSHDQDDERTLLE